MYLVYCNNFAQSCLELLGTFLNSPSNYRTKMVKVKLWLKIFWYTVQVMYVNYCYFSAPRISADYERVIPLGSPQKGICYPAGIFPVAL